MQQQVQQQGMPDQDAGKAGSEEMSASPAQDQDQPDQNDPENGPGSDESHSPGSNKKTTIRELKHVCRDLPKNSNDQAS